MQYFIMDEEHATVTFSAVYDQLSNQLQQYMLALEGARQAVLGCDLNGTKMANLARDLQVVLDGLARQGLLGTEAQRTLQKARELRAYTDASRRLEGIVTRMMEDLSKVIT